MILVGLTGRAGAGKNLVASLLPGFESIGLADPLYAGLATMLGVDEDCLRDRRTKELPLPLLGRSPRELLQTLGTDWGRDLVVPDLWVRLCRQRIDRLVAGGHDRIAVTDVRFSNEARMIRAAGGEVWHVVRPGAETTPHSHRSENGIPSELIDRVVVNSGSPDDLRCAVTVLWQERCHATAHA